VCWDLHRGGGKKKASMHHDAAHRKREEALTYARKNTAGIIITIQTATAKKEERLNCTRYRGGGEEAITTIFWK